MTEVLKFALTFLDVLPILINRGAEAVAAVERTREQIRRMADEGRDPTDEEWDALNELTQGKRESLHSDEM